MRWRFESLLFGEVPHIAYQLKSYIQDTQWFVHHIFVSCLASFSLFPVFSSGGVVEGSRCGPAGGCKHDVCALGVLPVLSAVFELVLTVGCLHICVIFNTDT